MCMEMVKVPFLYIFYINVNSVISFLIRREASEGPEVRPKRLTLTLEGSRVP